MERALVLGGATGLLGQALVEELHAWGNFDIKTLGRDDGNILDTAFIATKIKSLAPDLIFNTIAWTQVDAAEDHPKDAQKINAGFPEILAHIIQTLNCHLVHFSTDFVFNATEPKVLNESTPPKAESIYGETKLQGEEILLKLIPDKVTICRTAWLFGPHRKNFIETICRAGQKQGKLKVVSDQIGSPTYTRDLANISLKLASQKQIGIWHTVNSGQASWYELADFAIKTAQIDCEVIPIKSSEWPQKAKRPSYSVLNTQKLSTFLGYAPRPWQEAVADYLKEVSFL